MALEAACCVTSILAARSLIVRLDIDEVLKDQPVGEPDSETAIGQALRNLVGTGPTSEQRQQRHIKVGHIKVGHVELGHIELGHRKFGPLPHGGILRGRIDDG